MAIATTTALAIGAVAAAVGSGYGIYSGERADSMQKRSLASQGSAQDQATAAALSQRRQAEMAQAAANRKAPDLGELLAFEQNSTGASSTMLQGARRKPGLLGDV